ncbi:MAG: hypothetical protein JWQ69_5930 [Pseudomonas sp.]|nr:hypothetical protein [Pseudomonas sp.]
MGVIDQTIHKLSCEGCRIEEEQKVLDKGSGWGGSSWQSGVDFQHFETSWSGGGKTEPNLTQATCRKCGKPAKSESR